LALVVVGKRVGIGGGRKRVGIDGGKKRVGIGDGRKEGWHWWW
jgi:hypothetical protein